jgi:HrpA-like RNA helicase
MSATLELEKFQKYFKDIQPIGMENVVQIEGRTFPIEIFHSLEA